MVSLGRALACSLQVLFEGVNSRTAPSLNVSRAVLRNEGTGEAGARNMSAEDAVEEGGRYKVGGEEREKEGEESWGEDGIETAAGERRRIEMDVELRLKGEEREREEDGDEEEMPEYDVAHASTQWSMQGEGKHPQNTTNKLHKSNIDKLKCAEVREVEHRPKHVESVLTQTVDFECSAAKVSCDHYSHVPC